MADGRLYVLQASFAAGEISPDVANRVDLDKYQSALLQAKNFFIRPYGSAYRRPGLEHVADMTGYNQAVRLKEFGISESESYLLVFSNLSLEVWRDGVKKATVVTTYASADLPKLRFAQSASTMFIAVGTQPVKMLKRVSDTTWTLTEFIPSPGYFDVNTNVSGTTMTPSALSGTVTLTYSGNASVLASQAGNWVKITHKVRPMVKTIEIALPDNSVAKESDVIDAAADSAWALSSSGTWTGTLRLEYTDDDTAWTALRTYNSKDDFNISENGKFTRATKVRISANVSLGSLSASLTVGGVTKTLSISVAVTPSTQTSASMVAGEPGWKVVSHGTWTGSFEVQMSEDNSNWSTLRSYSSKDDFNVTEAGTFEDQTYIRVTGTITKGKLSVTLTRMQYKNTGTARITAVSGTSATAVVDKPFAYTEASDEWELGSWSAAYGYPSCVTFFQDRLCLAANAEYPYMVWMSRTGDYWNFEVEKASGEVLDDSAVALAFISRRDYKIKHMMAFSDLIVMTEGNEWIISGDETVTPKQVTPKMQTSRGCTDVEPELIGGQIVFVQKGAKAVRDMQYSYTTDSYDGMELTILARHMTQDKTIVDSAYKQEPDSMLVYVLSDGTAACLTYINEQKVYAWSRIVTDGKIKAVESVNTGSGNTLYFVVDRGTGRYLEKLHEMGHTDSPDDYIMLDCAKKGTYTTASKTITASWLANKTVDVLADGRHIAGLTANGSGTVTLQTACKKYVIGYPYESVLELPNIELQLQDGTMQGRKKKVSSVILRLTQSLAGRAGITEAKTDIIKFDELMNQTVTLYSGEKSVTVPNVSAGGFNDYGRVVVKSSYPYPFSVASVVRVVAPGG